MPVRFRTSIQLAPADLVANFEDVILDRVRSSLEGICSRYGYIRPGSIVITKRSIGSFVKQHFNGHIRFEMICKAEVCNPAIGSVFQAIVRNKNALGIHAESFIKVNEVQHPVLDIIIPKRSAGITSTVNLEDLQIGDTIHVEVLGKRYQLHDRKISIIGRAIREPSSKSANTNDVQSDDDEIAAIDQSIVDEMLQDEDEDAEDTSTTEDDDAASKSGESSDSDDNGEYTQKGGDDEDEDVVQEDEEYEESIVSENEEEYEDEQYDEY